MGKRSLTPVSCCVVFLALLSGLISPLAAQTREKPPGSPSDLVSSTTVRAFLRQIAFVKSFSVGYPYQFRQGRSGAGVGTITVDDLKDPGK